MKILVVDDESYVRDFVIAALSQRGYWVCGARDGREALDLVREIEFDLILCDVVMGEVSGFEVLKEVRGMGGRQPEVVLMTGHGSVEAALEAVQCGADDYICKPFSVGVLQAIALAVEQRRYPGRVEGVEAMEVVNRGEIIGRSLAMIEVVKTAVRVASTDLPVLIEGESGTGKELIARLIHRRSRRGGRSFVAVNCGALPDTLLESELFGHTRGAFTGAGSGRRGLFEEADGGTIFLDEVTETSSAFQVKLLRVLQEGEIRPLGTNVRKKVDVRVIAATNRDAQALAERGVFREDLLYRLRGAVIRVPALRERREDIRDMVKAFLWEYSGGRVSITKEAMMALERYDWPGNVRELKHMMQRLAALSGGLIRLEDLPGEVVMGRGVKEVIEELVPEGELPTLEELEASYLLKVLSAVGGNKSKAAQVMGIDRKTLYRMMERAGMCESNRS
jgi:DNA-binding NtrC family response regulator